MMQTINLQTTPKGVNPIAYASQYDVGREIHFLLFDGPVAYIPPVGTLIRVEGRKPDNTSFSYECTYNSNDVTVILTDQMTLFAEDIPCELRLAYNGNDIGTVNFTLSVEKSPIDSNIPISDTEIPAIIELARTEQYNAEAWAEGTRNGTPVGPTDPTYQNNAKYYAEHSSASISSLQDTDIQNPTDGQIIKYNGETEKWENTEESGGSSTLGGLTDVTITTPTNGQIIEYDAANDEWVNGDAPSGGGMVSHIIVESDAGESSVTVTLPSGIVKTCTQVAGSTTQWETTSDEYGTHIIDAYKDGDDAQAMLNIQYVGEYLVHDEHYYHTINVTVMSGASIVITGNGETYSGTGTGSAVAFAVHGKEATYTVTTSVDGVSAASQTVTTPATSGQSTSLTFQYGTINLTYANDFRGASITCTDGNKTITKTAPNDANAMTFYPPNTGNWSISGAASGVTYSASPNPVVVTSLSTAVQASLQTFATITVTIYGAKEDTITFTDAAGVAHTVTFASGQTSKSETLKVNPTGTTSITFTSSVAKNPDNLSANYSKNISLTTSTTEVDIMPQPRSKMLYWYGYKGDVTTSSYGGIWTKVEPTWNTHNATVTLNGTTHDCHFVPSNAVTTNKTHCIATSPSNSNQATGVFVGDTISNTFPSSNSPAYLSCTNSNADVPKVIVTNGSANGTAWTMTLDAIWYE